MSNRNQVSPYPLRIPPELRALLQKQADIVGRSLHTEIMKRLEKSCQQQETPNEQYPQI
ncbi:Arc family DNA-binding protein [Saezia sanguinis]|uniref:Arc family DNA-binding protein n=1 Tax=Saezia sanguinis TaxID=1965230 RepID=UPI003C6DD503